MKRILLIAKRIARPTIPLGHIYEVDEIQSFVRQKKNPIWIAYALDRESKQVVSYNIGPRTNTTLSVVTDTLRYAQAKYIYTDRLRNYRSLIDKYVHRTTYYGTNQIERQKLTVRTHLKRLSRKTLCLSRSVAKL